jgi:hypothetical protein
MQRQGMARCRSQPINQAEEGDFDAGGGKQNGHACPGRYIRPAPPAVALVMLFIIAAAAGKMRHAL